MIVGEYYNASKLFAHENEDEMKKNNISFKKNNISPMVVGEYYNASKLFARENEDEMKMNNISLKSNNTRIFRTCRDQDSQSPKARLCTHYSEKIAGCPALGAGGSV